MRRRYPLDNRSGMLCEEKVKRRGRKEAEGAEKKKIERSIGKRKWRKEKIKSRRQSSAMVIGGAFNGTINFRRDA